MSDTPKMLYNKKINCSFKNLVQLSGKWIQYSIVPASLDRQSHCKQKICCSAVKVFACTSVWKQHNDTVVLYLYLSLSFPSLSSQKMDSVWSNDIWWQGLSPVEKYFSRVKSPNVKLAKWDFEREIIMAGIGGLSCVPAHVPTPCPIFLQVFRCVLLQLSRIILSLRFPVAFMKSDYQVNVSVNHLLTRILPPVFQQPWIQHKTEQEWCIVKQCIITTFLYEVVVQMLFGILFHLGRKRDR